MSNSPSQNLVAIGLIARIGCWIVCGLGLLSGLTYAFWLITYSQGADSVMVLGIAGLAHLAFVAAFLVTMFPLLIWIYRAHANLLADGVSGLRHSPGWAVGSFFVPVINFVVPFQAMRALYNRSHGEPEELQDSTAEPVSSWWGCHLGAVLFFTVTAISSAIDAIPGVYVTTPFWADALLTVLYAILAAGSAFFLQQSIVRITQAQLAGVGISATFE